ncbi:MAG: GxxExxY protein [Flavobacteriia bacterium]|nr:GxxExxY protein [Flavobacteriia bacterium]
MKKKEVNNIAYKVFGLCIEVHKNLGPGLLESVYHSCLVKELELNNYSYDKELIIPVVYKGLEINTQLRCDLFIENCVVVELKSVKEFSPIFDAQVLTYMKLLKSPKGLLVNFNSYNLYEDGFKTFVGEYFNLLE